jgi:uncharacterized damage-inducible protein DinB
MKEGLLKAWMVNNEKNILLLQHLEETNLNARLAAKGRTVGEQLAHMHDNRVKWIEFVAKNLYNKEMLVGKNENISIALLTKSLNESAQIIEQVIHSSWEKNGKLPSFKSGLIPFVSYLISHESHHRGNILLTIKQSGFKIPDRLKWGLWEW